MQYMTSHCGFRRVAICAVTLIAAACNEASPIVEPDPPGTPGVRIIAGGNLTDTIQTQPVQALVVEVSGENGKLAPGVTVQFDRLLPSDTSRKTGSATYVCRVTVVLCESSGPVLDVTDESGRARANVRLGYVAGETYVRVTAGALKSTDSAKYTVLPGAAFKVRAFATDTTIDIGATAQLRGRVLDRFDNARADIPTVTVGAGNALTVDQPAGIVTGRDFGTQWAYTRFGALRDSTRVLIVPGGRLVAWSPKTFSIKLANVNGGAVRTIATNVTDVDLGVFPRFDPTGQHITRIGGTAQGVATRIVTIDTNGVLQSEISGVGGFQRMMTVRRMPDGSMLVVGARGADPLSGPFGLYRLSSDNSITRILTVPNTTSEELYGSADISPDGTRLAYLGNASQQNTGARAVLRVLTIATGALAVLDSFARAPRWSRQSDRIAFLKQSGGGNPLDGTLVIVNADGSNRRSLGSDVYSPGLAWSPDGAYIIARRAFIEESGSALQLVRVSDALTALLRFRVPGAGIDDFFQPDWR